MHQKVQERPILFFDGVCNLCNSTVQFILKHEDGPVLLFSPLQSEAGWKIMEKLPKDTDSLVLYDQGRVYIRSTAALKVAGYLKSPYRHLQNLQFIPTFIRDPIYRLLAKSRYLIFGKRAICMIPTPDLKERFV
ncbi:MAG: DUF393 domain-containing protein [Saprospiraceae bacterium]|nr:DUF393 domain-containing protein [Saprospiraceae bacterium]